MNDYEDELYFSGTCEECFGTGYDARGAACEYCGGSGYDMSGDSPTLPLPPFMADEPNLIKRIVSFAAVLFRRLFRRDSIDQIPF